MKADMDLKRFIITYPKGQTHISFWEIAIQYVNQKAGGEIVTKLNQDAALLTLQVAIILPLVLKRELVAHTESHELINLEKVKRFPSILLDCNFYIEELTPLLKEFRFVFVAQEEAISANVTQEIGISSVSDKPWLVRKDGDPNPTHEWQTAARYFARKLLEDKSRFKINSPTRFFEAIAQNLFEVGFHPRNNKDKKYNANSVQKSLNNTGIR